LQRVHHNITAANTSEEGSFLIDGKRRFLTDKLL
jgi:hypothetical protein